jgi:hypothetical protein
MILIQDPLIDSVENIRNFELRFTTIICKSENVLIQINLH